MSNRFKPGQEVVCVNAFNFYTGQPTGLIKHGIYTIAGYPNIPQKISNGSKLCYLRELEGEFKDSRFEPVVNISELKELLETKPQCV